MGEERRKERGRGREGVDIKEERGGRGRKGEREAEENKEGVKDSKEESEKRRDGRVAHNDPTLHMHKYKLKSKFREKT